MDDIEKTGIFLSLNDCAALYPRLKGSEPLLAEEERVLLLKMEKLLYGVLSVREMEELLEKSSANFDAL